MLSPSAFSSPILCPKHSPMLPAITVALLALSPRPLPSQLSRRSILPAIPGLVAYATSSPALAATAPAPAPLTELTEKEYGVSFKVPDGWAASTSFVNGGQKVLAASDPTDTDANVFAAFTPLRGDSPHPTPP